MVGTRLVHDCLHARFVSQLKSVQVILVFWSKRDVAIGRETKAHQIATTATSLGYAVGFTFIMVILLDGSWDALENIKPGSLDDLVVAIMCLIITTLFGTPMHVLSGYLIGLEVTRQTHFMKASDPLFTKSAHSILPNRQRRGEINPRHSRKLSTRYFTSLWACVLCCDLSALPRSTREATAVSAI